VFAGIVGAHCIDREQPLPGGTVVASVAAMADAFPCPAKVTMSKRTSGSNHILFAAAVFLLCVAVRVLDVFVVRSDEWIGEQVLTKVLGLAIVLAYVIWSGFGLARLGFRRPSMASTLGVGVGLTVAVMAATFALQFFVLAAQGQAPQFIVGVEGFAIGDQPDGGVGTGPAIGLISFNLVNALMEESLFRGLLITHVAMAMSAMRANIIQAVLFGLWHIVWPIRAVVDGDMSIDAAMVYSTGFVLVSTIMGFVWGCFFIWFRSLWVPIIAHTIHNAALNVFHITTISGASTVAFFTTAEAVLFLALLPAVYWWKRRLDA
jgi:membrane protease YdiL (CAAX protease family)